MLVLDDTVVFLHQCKVCVLVFSVFPATPFSIELKLLLLAASRHTLGWEHARDQDCTSATEI